MRATIGFFSLLLSLACGGEQTPATSAELQERKVALPLPAAESPHARVPQLLAQQPRQFDSILSERLNWLRYDVSAVLRLSIDKQGEVLQSVVASVAPVDDALARDFAAESARGFEHAKFETLSGVEYPYSFNVNVRFAAPRDANGRLK